MEISPECPACFSIQLMRTLAHQGLPQWRDATAQAFGRAGGLWPTADNPGPVITELYRTVAMFNDDPDPYRQAKTMANDLAEEFWQLHPLALTDLAGRALYATAANILDAGLNPDPSELFTQFMEAVELGWGRNDWPQFELLVQGARIVYLMDNAGEAVLDRELMRSLTAQGGKITAVVRGAPFLNDVTTQDVQKLRIPEVVDHVIDTGTDGCGWDPAAVGSVARLAMESADLIVAKGIANLETMSHRDFGKPALYLYRSKCPPSARAAGVSMHQNVAWLQPLG